MAEHFVTNFGMLLQRREPEHHTGKKKEVCCLQGHSEGLHDQNMILGVMIHHHKPECLVQKI